MISAERDIARIHGTGINERAVAAAGDTLERTLRGAVDRAGSPGGTFRARPAEPPLGQFLASSAL